MQTPMNGLISEFRIELRLSLVILAMLRARTPILNVNDSQRLTLGAVADDC